MISVRFCNVPGFCLLIHIRVEGTQWLRCDWHTLKVDSCLSHLLFLRKFWWVYSWTSRYLNTVSLWLYFVLINVFPFTCSLCWVCQNIVRNAVLGIVVCKVSCDDKDVLYLPILESSALNSSHNVWNSLACFIKKATIKTPTAQPEAKLPDEVFWAACYIK